MKKALVLTYHVKNCSRVGGFHHFISYLISAGYSLDWVTTTVNISWIKQHNDRENYKNFIDLVVGKEWRENDVKVRHFAIPVWIPAKIARMLKMKLGFHYWASFERMKRKLSDSYDVILVESAGCQYIERLRECYPTARIVYRPSDILESFSKISDAVDIEINAISKADIVLCCDENQKAYYDSKLIEKIDVMTPIEILRNPITTDKDLEYTESFIPASNPEKSIVYLGVSFVDLDLIEYAARKLHEMKFYVIGPFNRTSHDNIVYTGSLGSEEYMKILEKADVGISPVKKRDDGVRVLYGYTRKIITYMKCLLPIVTTSGSNYLNVPGFADAKTDDEFVEFLVQASSYTAEDRVALKDPYIRTMTMFSESVCKDRFLNYCFDNDCNEVRCD